MTPEQRAMLPTYPPARAEDDRANLAALDGLIAQGQEMLRERWHRQYPAGHPEEDRIPKWARREVTTGNGVWTEDRCNALVDAVMKPLP